MSLDLTRKHVAEAARELLISGLVRGTGGNVSMRDEETALIAITPSAVPYDVMQPADVAVVDEHGHLREGRYKPSTEMPMHLEAYRRLSWVRGVVHTHSPYATAFACLNRPIEPLHYLIALAGKRIPVAPYATYGTDEIGRAAMDVIGDSLAVLLQNHGVLAIGHSLAEAMTAASTTEYVAELYHHCLQLGQPVLLPDDELAHLQRKFAGYQPQPPPDDAQR
jgi:L-fuculose-phosphate aldolase